MENGNENGRRIRFLSVALVTVVMALSLILLVAVCTGRVAGGASEETTRRSFWELLGDQPFDPDNLPGTLDWGDMTREPTVETKRPEPITHPADTLEPWESGLEWPTLPPTPDPDAGREWPSLPADWDTLPADWETVPHEWEADSPAVEDIPSGLAGASGELGRPGGALGAGIAAGLTVLEIDAEIDDRLYLKMKSFGDYTGQGWAEEPLYPIEVGGVPAEFIPSMLLYKLDPFDGYGLTVHPVMDLRVLTYYLVKVDGQDSGDRPYGLWYRHYGDYIPAPDVGGVLAEAEAAYSAFVKENYLHLDDTTRAYMELVIRTEGFEADDPDVVDLVAAYIQNAATYNLNYNHNLDNEPNAALAFLGAYKEGVCRHFATAATLLYRALGIPARYTVGFAADVTAGETTAVKGKDAHAWVEIYEEGFGWRCVEVTGASAPEEPDWPYETETESTQSSTWGDVLAGVDGKLTASDSVPDIMRNSPVFTVTSQINAHHLLKIKSFGNFTDDGWEDAVSYPGDPLGVESPGLLTGTILEGMGETTWVMSLYSPLGAVAVPYYSLVADGRVKVTDTRVTGDGSGEYDVLYYPHTFHTDSLLWTSEMSLAEYEKTYREFVYGNYLSVDIAVAEYLCNRFVVKGLNVYEGTMEERVAAFVRESAVYDPDCRTVLKNDLGYMRAFMGGNGVGNSRHFATVATLLYRAMGIPARYTVGYETYTYGDEAVDVLGSDAYAWVEIYVDGFGWKPVDVTGRTAEGRDPHEPRNTLHLSPTVLEKKYDGTLLTHTGELVGFEEYTALGYTYKATVSGSRRVVGMVDTVIEEIVIYDPEGQDVTDQFEIRRYGGHMRIYYEKLTFAGEDVTFVYNGGVWPEMTVRLVSGELPEGYTYRIEPSGAFDEVGVGEAVYTARIYWMDQKDVTNQFIVETEYGVMEILPAPLTLKAADAEKVYDGTPLTAVGYEIVGGGLAPGDTVEVCTVEGSRTQVGRTESVITRVVIRNAEGKDVTRNYGIETVAGEVRITR